MNPLIYLILITLIPGIELRGSIPVGIALNIDPVLVFAVCVLLNILIIPMTFVVLDLIHPYLMKISFYSKFVNKARSKKFGSKSYVALAAFVAIPLPLTGAYTGSLIAWLVSMDRKRAFVAIAAGVLAGGLIVTAVVLGALQFLKWIV